MVFWVDFISIIVLDKSTKYAIIKHKLKKGE